MHLIDTHAHIHFDNYKLDADEVLKDARKSGVEGVIAVSCDLQTSYKSIEFAKSRDGVWSAVGIHPHEAQEFNSSPDNLQKLCKLASEEKDSGKLVAIGECGLDYYYQHSPKNEQLRLLEAHLKLAQEVNLPMIFHVRDAHDDFWPVFDKYKGIRGVMHSFSATKHELEQALARGLYIGLNGIMTFTRDDDQLEMAKLVPKERLVLETDAPYLTPKPYRGSICKPEHVRTTAEFLAHLRGEKYSELAAYTNYNARQLFNLKRTYDTTKLPSTRNDRRNT